MNKKKRKKYEASWTCSTEEMEQSVIIKFREGEIINN
jgi:hypothetical protein